MAPKLNQQIRDSILEEALELSALVEDVVSQVWEVIGEKEGFERIDQPEAQSAIGKGLVAEHKEKIDEVLLGLLEDTEQVKTFDDLENAFDQQCTLLASQNLPDQKQITHGEVEQASGYEGKVKSLIARKKARIETEQAAAQVEREQSQYEKPPRLYGSSARLALDMQETIASSPEEFINKSTALYEIKQGVLMPLHYTALLAEFSDADRFGKQIRSATLPKEALELGLGTTVEGLKKIMYKGGDEVSGPLGPIGVVEIFKTINDWPWQDKVLKNNSNIQRQLRDLLQIIVDDLRTNRFQYTSSGFARIFEGVSRLSHHHLPRDFYPVMATVFEGVSPLEKADAKTIVRSISGATLSAITPDFLQVLQAKLQSVDFDQDLFRATVSMLRSFHDVPQVRSFIGMLHHKYAGGSQKGVTGTSTDLSESFYGMQNFADPAVIGPEDGLMNDLFTELLADNSKIYFTQLGKYFAGMACVPADQIPEGVFQKLDRYERFAEADMNQSFLKSAIEMLQGLYNIKQTCTGYHQQVRDFISLGFRVIESMADQKQKLGNAYLDGVMQVYRLHGKNAPASLVARYPKHADEQRGKSVSPAEAPRLKQITESIQEEFSDDVTITQNDRPVPGFECDIVLHLKDKKIAIELDGADHASHVVKDARRDAFLAQKGIRVLRIGYHDVEEVLPLVRSLMEGEKDTVLGAAKLAQLGISEAQAQHWPDMQKVYAESK